jgi:hypothetical protein
MSEGKSKYNTPALLIPIKPPAPAGKRSDPALYAKGSFPEERNHPACE